VRQLPSDIVVTANFNWAASARIQEAGGKEFVGVRAEPRLESCRSGLV
jgi:hypothetical protein